MGEPKKKDDSNGLDLDRTGEFKAKPLKELSRPKSKKEETSIQEASLEGLDLDKDGSFSKEIKREASRQTGKLKVSHKKKPEESEEDNINIELHGKGERLVPPPIPSIKKEKNPEIENLEIECLDLDKTGEFSSGAIADFAKDQVSKAKEQRVAKKENSAIVLEFEAFKKNLEKEPFFNAKKDQYPRIMGDYFVYDHMADGGMAKICRGKYLGEHEIDAKDNLIVIKMIKEEFSKKNDYIAMFLDEIDVAFNFRHPNISAMYDYGKSKDNLFVSMEYIHGKDLMEIISDLRGARKCLPVPIAVSIAIKMCHGLDYVHNYKDPKTGEELHIVHRDISPHNVMVSFKGEVKVIDFGIAKSDSGKQKEEDGTVKGKINYFAPEYLEGKEIDHRYDQFAVALTLWEMLTGKRTFDKKEQILTLKAILDCKPEKPSQYNNTVDPKLDEIIIKALSKEPGDRFQNMQVFSKVLEEYLAEKFPKFVPQRDLSAVMRALYKTRYQKDVNLFKNWATIAIDGIKEKLKQVKSFVARINAFKESSEGETHRKEMVFDFGFEEEVISVLDKGNMQEGLELDMSTPTQRRKERERAAKNKQMAIAAMMRGESPREHTSTSTNIKRFRRKQEERVHINFPTGKFIVACLALVIFYSGYKFFTKPNMAELVKLEEQMLEKGQEFDIHKAYRNSGEYKVLSNIGYIDYEKIVGREKASEFGFFVYSYEKFMIRYINRDYNAKIYMPPEEINEEVYSKSETEEEIKKLEENRDYLNDLIKEKRRQKRRRPSNRE